MSEKYNTYLVEYVRNNANPQAKSLSNDPEVYRFMMLDYFDVLYYREIKDHNKTYLNYFSFSNIFEINQQTKVSYKTLNLYEHADKQKVDPFTYDNNDNCLSDLPFLGIIQICLCKESYVKDEKDLLSLDVDAFLSEKEKEILNIVNAENTDELIRKIYRSSTTSDFCLVIRTNSVEKIYDMAAKLNNSRTNTESNLNVITYTNIGIECKRIVLPDGMHKYCSFSESFLRSYGTTDIALRFAVDSHMFDEMKLFLRSFPLKKGLFGRYDYLIHLPINEFAKIYPKLCERSFENIDFSNTEKNKNLGDFFLNSNVRNVNERVLIDENSLNSDEIAEFSTNNISFNNEIDQNDKLKSRIERISRQGNIFLEENRAFRDLQRSMEEMYNAFSPLALEKDSIINWAIWIEDMNYLCDCIERSLETHASLKLNEDRKKLRVSMLKSWRTSIQAINKYTCLVQNVNYQTYQAPVYEMQTQIDTEKIMIAYREAMNLYVKNYMRYENAKNEQVSCTIPIIYPELLKDKVEITVPFINLWSNGFEKRFAICTVPSFEYFGRLYDLLPWITHEASHYLRVLKRGARNKFVIRYVFKHVFKLIVESIFKTYSHPDRYHENERSEDILIDCFVEVATQELDNIIQCKYDSNAPSYEQIMYEMAVYLDMLFPYQDNVEERFFSINSSMTETLIKHMRETGLLFDDKKYNFEKLNDNNKDLSTVEDLIHKILDKYADRISGLICKDVKKQLISYTDLVVPQNQFEEKIINICDFLTLETCNQYDAALKEYFFAVKDIYRLYKKYYEIPEKYSSPQEHISSFLSNVYNEYKIQLSKHAHDKYERFLCDSEYMYIMRNIGLLNDNKDLFCSRVMNVFMTISSSYVQDIKIFRTRLYRELFADLLMAVSLQLTSFGYCRQVLQTVSDARIEDAGFLYDNTDYYRFRIIAAVLAYRKDKSLLEEKNNTCIVKADSLISQGRTYCLATLHCIMKQLQKSEKCKRSMIDSFMGNINEALDRFFADMSDKGFKQTPIYVMLHGIDEDTIPDVTMLLDYYKDVVAECNDYRYQFWRIECFCRGMNNIITNGNIMVDGYIFHHFVDIYDEIYDDDKDSKGCIWERELWTCLADVKKDVGEFYNYPEQAYTKNTEDKLENTIDFIQNFYYHNRFSVVNNSGVWKCPKSLK